MDEDTRKELALRFLKQAYEHQMRKELNEAVELYKKSIEAYPTADAHTFLGWTYSWMGRIEDAIAECHKAIEVDPTFGNPYNDIGSYLIMKGQIDEAVPWLERALQAPRYESYCYPHMNLGRVFEAKRDWLRAKQEYSKALAENEQYKPAAEGVARIRGYLN
jgi:Tfp pilus assembly protein PilF